ncbi:hypothetical protein [Microcella alkalica]|uniref:Hemagglutinin n=1 Tax=Microcella alkalica TaxID=355930 RepID=A0A839E8G4_9MICO|nr:hypothetical protein [Microcella alkalica]MBA8848939.1 hypothetical protein [Microcella alkalica]
MSILERTRARRFFAACIASFAVVAALLMPVSPAQAATATDFDPGFIISDQQFYDREAMTEAEIGNFLQAQIGTCLNTNCLNVIKTSTTDRPADAMCDVYRGESEESTARILFKVQTACGISARVLLVTLQKEQSLVTHRQPTLSRIDRAMGYACPDDTTRPGWCDPAFAGLYNQLYRAAWQMKRYGNPPGTSSRFTWFPVGRATAVLHHPNRDCGTRTVTITNNATAALYYYTPYTPNAAALANLYGTGDACSSYGNRNFWRFYSDWFGSPTGPFTPLGNLEAASGAINEIRLTGWAHDPNSTSPISVHAYVDGSASAWSASLPRPDVQSAIKTAGPAHGFDLAIPAAPGKRSVCLYMINVGPGQNTLLGCRSVVVEGVAELGRPPFGTIDEVSASAGSVSIRGWAIDPDTTAPIDVHVYVDGRGIPVRAADTRPDVGAAYALYGPNHGFSATIPAAPGNRQICVYAINSVSGVNPLLGCRSTTVPNSTPTNAPPKGNFEGITLTAGALTVTGWAFDPDSAAPIDVHVYVNGRGSSHLANEPRPDVIAAFPGRSAGHGFSLVVPAGTSPGTVCIYAIDTTGGTNPTLGCRSI